jgi:hypothetical protein
MLEKIKLSRYQILCYVVMRGEPEAPAGIFVEDDSRGTWEDYQGQVHLTSENKERLVDRSNKEEMHIQSRNSICQFIQGSNQR